MKYFYSVLAVSMGAALACGAGPAQAFDVNTAWKEAQKTGVMNLPAHETVTLKKRLYAESLKKLTVDLQGGVIDGSALPKGTSCFHLNTMKNVTFKNGTIKNCPQDGIHFNGVGLTVEDMRFFKSGNCGILTGDSSNLAFRRIETAFHGGANTGGKGSHGIYVSQKAENVLIEDINSHDNSGAAVQVNAVPGGGKNVTIRRVEGYGNGSQGGACLNVAGVTGGSIEGNNCHDNLSGGIAVFDDGNARFPSKDVRIIANRITFQPGKGRYCVTSSAKGNKNITVGGNDCQISGKKFYGEKFGVTDTGNRVVEP